MRSYKPMVETEGNGKFYTNALRFATEQEAKWYVDDLSMRWLAVREVRVDESDDPVNYQIVRNESGQLEQSRVEVT